MKTSLTAQTLTMLWLSLLVTGCGGKGETSNKSDKPAAVATPLAAKVVEVQLQTWPTVVRTQGSLNANEVSTIGAKVAGRVVDVRVDFGATVQQDDVLASLDRQEFELLIVQAEAQLAQARAAVGLKPVDDAAMLDPLKAPPVREAKAVWDEAQQQVERLRQLRQQNAVSDAELNQAEAAEHVADARYSSALNGVREKIAAISVQSAELALAQQRLDDSTTRAPTEAIVQRRFVAPGTYVQVGQPLFELARTRTLRFRGAMPERYAQLLRIGQSVKLHVESLSEPREARISRISPTLDEMSRSLVFEADVDNAGKELRAGLFAEAEVILDPDAASIVVPRSALVRFAGVEKVWRVVDGMAQEAVVNVGREEVDRLEIVDGLTAGETILVDGTKGRVAQVTPTATTHVAGAQNPTPPQ